MLPFEEDREVVEIEYGKKEWIPEVRDLRHSVVSVLCTDNYNQQFAVEMQIDWTASFRSRILLDASEAYILRFGGEQRLPCPVYVIKLVNEIFEKSPEMQDIYYHHYKTVNARNAEERIDGLELIFVELPKFKPHICTARKMRDLWLRFLTEINESTTEVPSKLFSEPIREAVYCSMRPYTETELNRYERSVMSVMDERSLMSDSKEEGRTAERAKIITNSRKAGLSNEIIAEITGLTVNEVNEILKQQEILNLKKA
jgi:predicted transposase/invertase (TIGR01784 family)